MQHCQCAVDEAKLLTVNAVAVGVRERVPNVYSSNHGIVKPCLCGDVTPPVFEELTVT